MFVHLIKVSSDMLFNKISRYLQFKISTMPTIHFAPDYISSFVSAYSCLGPSLIPGAILACVWLKSECRGGRMQKMMCCIDSVDCPTLHWYCWYCCPFRHRQHQSFRRRGRGSAAVYRHCVLTEKMAHCLKLLHTPGCGGGDGLLLARDWEEIQLNRFSWPLHSTLLPASSE